MKTSYIITYDISDNKRLTKTFKTIRGFGDHLQYSVFRCDLSHRELAILKSRLSDIIKNDEDQVLFIPLGPPDGYLVKGIHAMGRSYVHEDLHCLVF